MEAQTNNLFDNFEDLEQAYLNDHISLDMYINEYNKLTKTETVEEGCLWDGDNTTEKTY